MPEFVHVFALIAATLMVTALAAGLVERSPLSFPLMFLAFGFGLGEGGLGLIVMGARDETLEVVTTLTLSLVLFLDATKLQLSELGRRWVVPFLVLVPGTGLIIALSAVPLALLFDFTWTLAFIGGAVLASTDPVVLREILRDERIPRSVRQVLRIEAGMNDIVVLPVVLILITVALGELQDTARWTDFLVRLLLFGPVLGLTIGGFGSWLMRWADGLASIRREYQALYGVGLVLASYTAATVVGGDGFLSAFAAGVSVVVLNPKLCDCFLEYGEVTSEMAMLVAFVLFGVVMSGILGTVPFAQALVMSVLVVFAIRPSVMGFVLARARMSWEAHALIAWFGPRGLNSLLLALLVVQANVPGAELLLAVVGVVVLVSVTVHGASATPVSVWYGRRAATETLQEERESTAAGLFLHDEVDVNLIAPDMLDQLLSGPSPPLILDVRSRSSYERDSTQILRSVRVLPDQVADWIGDLPTHRLVVAYCT